MARQAKAVICRELNKPVVVEEITIDSPKRGEVMVKIAACGVCHSDLSATNGTIALPPPLILGHEAAGKVVEVGEGVTGIAVGDHVVPSFIYMCGKCRFCSAGRPVLCTEQGKALLTPLEGTPAPATRRASRSTSSRAAASWPNTRRCRWRTSSRSIRSSRSRMQRSLAAP
jgi:S-(hydroxymethyl)glutathione dehydrogenase/alcohol dehydrogenase